MDRLTDCSNQDNTQHRNIFLYFNFDYFVIFQLILCKANAYFLEYEEIS